MRWPAIAACALAAACAAGPDAVPQDPQAAFFARIESLCDGHAYAGRLVSDDAADAAFRNARMILGPATCDGAGVRIPFTVNEDRSRTWVLTQTRTGLRLKHDHRHRDGTEDVLTNYGGDSLGTGAAARQDFPADEETRALFIREGIEVSTQNTWSVDIDPGQLFAYQMQRPERLFRVVFDLTTPVAAPPPPWGVEPIE